MEKNFLDLFFPKFCLGCQKEGDYLCQDCLFLIDFSDRVFKKGKEISGLYCATDYENFLVKRLIQNLKYEPFAKGLASTLAFLIIIYFKNLEKPPEFLKKKEGFYLIPIPLYKKRLKWRGFNQAEEIGKFLSKYFEIPLLADALIKTKDTLPQLNLPQALRKENVKDVFVCKRPELIKGKKILLIDDVFTTGSTMDEAARALKEAGAKQVSGIVVAGSDKI